MDQSRFAFANWDVDYREPKMGSRIRQSIPYKETIRPDTADRNPKRDRTRLYQSEEITQPRCSLTNDVPVHLIPLLLSTLGLNAPRKQY